MATETAAPNIGSSLIRVHRAVTRAFDVAIEGGQQFVGQGQPDEATREGYTNYVRSLISFLRGHHQGEDDLLFPYFRDKLPDVPYEQLGRQHHELEALLIRLEGILDAEAAPGSAEALAELLGGLEAARALWHPHIRIEEEHMSAEILGRLLPAEEHVRIGRASAEHSQAHSGPDYLVVPFFLYNLGEQDRAAMARMMPPIVTEELVPHVWKEKWASMKPFLLA
jgi:hemerythrin-like domain-containing protein